MPLRYLRIANRPQKRNQWGIGRDPADARGDAKSQKSFACAIRGVNALAELACFNPRNRIIISDSGGIPIVLRV